VKSFVFHKINTKILNVLLIVHQSPVKRLFNRQELYYIIEYWFNFNGIILIYPISLDIKLYYVQNVWVSQFPFLDRVASECKLISHLLHSRP